MDSSAARKKARRGGTTWSTSFVHQFVLGAAVFSSPSREEVARNLSCVRRRVFRLVLAPGTFLFGDEAASRKISRTSGLCRGQVVALHLSIMLSL